MSKHTMDVLYLREIDLGDDEPFELKADLVVTFSYHPGYRGSRTEPPEAASAEFISCEMRMGRSWQPAPKYIQEWAEEWIHGEGQDEAVEWAEDNRQPDPDRHRDWRMDDHITTSWSKAA